MREQDRWRTAWYGPQTRPEVAAKNRISESKLARFWRDEKAAGRLPDEPRPHFVERCRIAEAGDEPIPPASADDDAITDVSKMSPLPHRNPRFNRQCDAMLAALRKHHAAADSAAAHDYRTYQEECRQ